MQSLESADPTSTTGSEITTLVPSAASPPSDGRSDGETSSGGLTTEGSDSHTVDENRLLELVLTGYNTTSKVTAHTGWDPSDVKRVLDDPKFQLSILAARRDMAMYVVNWVKRHSLEYAQEMHLLATGAMDERVKFQANKDLLDRAGTTPQTRIALGTPQQYKQLVEELQDTPANVEVE